MLHRRLAYAAALGAAVLFQIFFRFYLSTFVLVLVLLFSLLSLVLSLPGMLRGAPALSPTAPSVVRGETAQFQAVLRNPTRLPLSRVQLNISYVNQMTGEVGRVRREVYGASRGARLTLELPAPHCGRVLCRLERVRVCDLMGLFALRPGAPGPCALLVLPPAVEPDVPPELAGSRDDGVRLLPRPGGGPGEDYDLRGYRPGDPMKNVHWKLSSKRDELVVREVLEPHRAQLVLTFDHFGTPEALDRTFARLYALSRWLLAHGRPHHIQWADPAGGGRHTHSVADEAALLRCLEAAFSTPAPPAGRSILDEAIRLPGGERARHLHVTPEGLEGGGGQ